VTEEKTIHQQLREPFPAEVIGKLPRVTCRDCSQNHGQCSKHKKAKCAECGAWISPAHIHLDYVGHAAVTDRLLEVDPEWNWEPCALDEHGAPLIQARGNIARFWIKLTIGGITRLGVGTCDGGKNDAEKELIGDAIRNAAMRFGVALDLWSKEPLTNSDSGDEPLSSDEVPSLPVKELEDFEASIHFAETIEDLRKVGRGINKRGIKGAEHERLSAAYALRKAEIEAEEKKA